MSQLPSTADVLSLVAQHWAVVPLSGAVAEGTNNLTVLVGSRDRRFVARIHQNVSLDRVLAEHRLLAAVGAAALPFHIPAPIPTRSGETVVSTQYGPASLTGFLEGAPPQTDNPRHQHAAGVALAQLLAALATVPRDLAPNEWTGALEDITPDVADLDDLCRRFDAEPKLAQYTPMFHAILQRHVAPPDALPRQIVHGDYGYANLLMQGDDVSAVLDFETAGWDVRVNDLVAALSTCTRAPDPEADEHVRKICRGFGSVMRFTAAEVQAVPALLRARVLTVVVWRAGRWIRGHDSPLDVAERLEALAEYDTAVRARGERLVDMIAPLVT